MQRLWTTVALLAIAGAACRRPGSTDARPAASSAMASVSVVNQPPAGVSELEPPPLHASEQQRGFTPTMLAIGDTFKRISSRNVGCERIATFVKQARVLDGWGQPLSGACVNGDRVLTSSGPDRTASTPDDLSEKYSFYFRVLDGHQERPRDPLTDRL
jgi:hypothetical protein